MATKDFKHLLTTVIWMAVFFQIGGEAADRIELDGIYLLMNTSSDLLLRMACSNPYSIECVQYVQEGRVSSNAIAEGWMAVINETDVEIWNRNGLALWNYLTNLTAYNAEEQERINEVTGRLANIILDQTKAFQVGDLSKLDPTMKRLYERYFAGTSTGLNEGQMAEYSTILGEMSAIYNEGKACVPAVHHHKSSRHCMPMDPDLHNLMATSRDYQQLMRAWQGWRNGVGRPMRKLYPMYVKLSNIDARSTGYPDAAAAWLGAYEDSGIEDAIDRLWEAIKPAYFHLHTFVRRRLVDFYGADLINPTGPIPAHVLGNMWAQEWANIYDIAEPFPGHGTIDVTNVMEGHGWTAEAMFHVANRFFVSLGLEAVPASFWSESMLTRPSGRNVSCHGGALDMFKHRDVRVKMCAKLTMQHLLVAHHEMGHCQYYLQYRHQHALFRTGANPGFGEAVGDTVAMSVVTPSYLHSLGLIERPISDYKSDINYLFKVALYKLVFIPFALVVDKWRWQTFRGQIKPEQYNQAWWNLRRQYQGVEPPAPRDTRLDFDPGAKFHVASGTPFIRYFISYVIQFQFHKALCDASGYTGPLYLCNVFNSKKAGHKLSDMLKMGASRPWKDAMEVMTGQREMDAGPLLEYFRPLTDWLTKENRGHHVGWD